MLASIKGLAGTHAALPLEAIVVEALVKGPASRAKAAWRRGNKQGGTQEEEEEEDGEVVVLGEEEEEEGEGEDNSTDAGEAGEAGQSSEAAGGAWVRIAPAAELLLLRALRYAERASHAAAMKPAPQTRMMRAALVAKPPRTASAVPYAPTPLFATRRHFEVTEVHI